MRAAVGIFPERSSLSEGKDGPWHVTPLGGATRVDTEESLSGFGGYGGCFDHAGLVECGDQVGRVSILGFEHQIERVGQDKRASFAEPPQPPRGLQGLQIAP